MKCAWCRGAIASGSRADARYCSKRCRQAAHRAKAAPATILPDGPAGPVRLAYADPPYVGLARRYYGEEPTYAGEVDHAALLAQLATYAGFALSCSSRSIPLLSSYALDAGISDVRLAIWHRHRPWSGASGYEGVLFRRARPSATPDVLLGVGQARRPTHPEDVIGMKPPAFSAWLFGLMGAQPGDVLDDLFPGSGLVARAWRQWAGEDVDPPAHATVWSLAVPSPGARGDG